MASQEAEIALWSAKGITPENIAKVFFDISNGDKRALSTSDKAYKRQESIWGRATEQILSTEHNVERNRLLLYRFWFLNRKNVVDIYNGLCKKKKTTVVKPKPTAENQKYRGCFCESHQYIPLLEEQRIECLKCKRWLHTTCANVRLEDIAANEDFVCFLCLENVNLPKIFDDTRSQVDDDSPSRGSMESLGSSGTLPSLSSPIGSPNNKSTPQNSSQSSNIVGPREKLNKSNVLETNGQSRGSKKQSASKKLNALFSSTSKSNAKSKKSNETLPDSWSDISDDEFASSTPQSRTVAGNSRHSVPKSTTTKQKDSFHLSDDDFVSPRKNTKVNQHLASDHNSSTESSLGEEIRQERTPIKKSSPSLDGQTFLEKESTIFSDDEKSSNHQSLSLHKNLNDNDFDDWDSPVKESNQSEGKKEKHKDQVDEPGNSDWEEEEPVDVSGVKRNFTMTLTSDQWKKIIKLNEGKSGVKKTHFTVLSSYSVTLSNEFDKYNKVCSVTLDKRRLNSPLGSHFFVAYSHCTNPSCSAQWRFFVPTRPRKNNNATVYVSNYEGTIRHLASIPSGRKWTGELKEDAMKKLREKTPAATRLEYCAKADMEAVRNGKITTMKSLRAFQMMNEKIKKAKDLHADVFLDLVKTKNDLIKDHPDKSYPGYIQQLQAYPTKILLLMAPQMEILKMMQKLGPVSVFLDASGGLTEALGEPYDSKEVFIYTLLVLSPVKGKSALPLCEMLTSSHTHCNVYTWLFTFFHTFQKRFSITADHYGLLKIEIDFSRVMLTTLVRLFHNEPLEGYINQFWNFYATDRENPVENLKLFPIHVCRFHTRKTIRRKLETLFPKARKDWRDVVDFYERWAQKIVHGGDLHSFDRRIKDVGIVALSKYYTPLVENRIDNFKNPTKRDTLPWEHFKIAEYDSKAPIWSRTAFGQYSHSIFTKCEAKIQVEENNAVDNGYLPNPFYSRDFIDYLRTFFLPYFPIISHMVYNACGIPILDDTNNAIEGYFGLLKTNLHKVTTRKTRMSRFVRDQCEYTKGLCNATESILISLGKNTQENDEGKTSQKRRGPVSSQKIDIDSEHSKHDNYKTSRKFENKDTNQHSPKDVEDDWNLENQDPLKFTGKNYEKLSPQKQKEKFRKPVKKSKAITEVADFVNLVPLVKYGGVFEDRTALRFTCNIDSSLQVLVALVTKFPAAERFLEEMSEFSDVNRAINAAVSAARYENHSLAKTIWIRDVLRDNPTVRDGSMLETEYNNAFHFVSQLFPVKKIHKCSREACEGFNDPSVYSGSGRRNRFENSHVGECMRHTPDLFEQLINSVHVYEGAKCFCGSVRLVRHEFNFVNRPFIFYPLLSCPTKPFNERDLSLHQTFGKVRYTVFAYTCVYGEDSSHLAVGSGSEEDYGVSHFVVKFLVGKKRVVYDGLRGKPVVESKLSGDTVTSLWLIPEVNVGVSI